MKGAAMLDGPAVRYAGAGGDSYFAWQRSCGQKSAIYNRKLFQPLVAENNDVLDFGCGGGYMLRALSCRTKVGVDVNPFARAEAAKLGIEVFADIAELGDRKFDVIITSHCLEHVTSPYETLAGLRRILHEDGKIVLLLPLDDWRSQPWVGPDMNFHLYTWTPKLLGNLLVAAGFDPVSIRIVTRVSPPRFDEYIWAFSERMFEVLSCILSIALRRRQILALAKPAK
jgi:SAM-dependent methyltransferase